MQLLRINDVTWICNNRLRFAGLVFVVDMHNDYGIRTVAVDTSCKRTSELTLAAAWGSFGSKSVAAIWPGSHFISFVFSLFSAQFEVRWNGHRECFSGVNSSVSARARAEWPCCLLTMLWAEASKRKAQTANRLLRKSYNHQLHPSQMIDIFVQSPSPNINSICFIVRCLLCSIHPICASVKEIMLETPLCKYTMVQYTSIATEIVSKMAINLSRNPLKSRLCWAVAVFKGCMINILSSVLLIMFWLFPRNLVSHCFTKKKT